MIPRAGLAKLHLRPAANGSEAARRARVRRAWGTRGPAGRNLALTIFLLPADVIPHRAFRHQPPANRRAVLRALSHVRPRGYHSSPPQLACRTRVTPPGRRFRGSRSCDGGCASLGRRQAVVPLVAAFGGQFGACSWTHQCLPERFAARFQHLFEDGVIAAWTRRSGSPSLVTVAESRTPAP